VLERVGLLTGRRHLPVRVPYRRVERQLLIEASFQPGGREPAPAPLDLVQAFVNTVDREHGPDLFDEADGLREWLAVRGWQADPTAADLRRARAVREALRTLMWANHIDGVDVEEPVAVLDDAADRARLAARFGPAGLVPQAGGVPGILGTVLAAVHSSMTDGSWGRLKACPGDRCGWAFYDRSVNGSSQWCSMRICGNRTKARAYYRRRRDDA
jgi:predicted RNA-binding Zn ribbon-like protein